MPPKAEVISPSSGADLLLGFNGGDTLDGDGGADILFGGLGNDIFDFNAVGDSGVGAGLRDTVMDFVSGTDDLNFNTIDANAGVGGNQNFTLTAGGGTGAFTGAAQLRYVQIDTNADSVLDPTLIQGNVNADMAADFEILLQNYTGTIMRALGNGFSIAFNSLSFADSSPSHFS